MPQAKDDKKFMRPAFHKGGDRPCKHARQQKGQGAKCKGQHPKYKFNHSFHNAGDYIPTPPSAKQSISTSPPAKKNFQEFPFRRKPESHSRDSENFPRSGTLQWSPIGECGFAAEIPAFAGMEDGRRRQLKEFPFPRKRESRGAASSATHRRQATLVSASRNFPLTREEIPAFAGMEDGRRRQLKEFPFRRKPESHSRVSENFPRSGTLQWSPVGECGFAAEIPAFAGMEDGGGVN